MLNLRTWTFTAHPASWVIQCKHCAAGWIPSRARAGDDYYDPINFIEHAMVHQRRLSRIEQLRSYIEIVAHNAANVQIDLLASRNDPALMVEREHFAIWDRWLRDELATLLREGVTNELRPRRAYEPGDNAWLPNKSFITHGHWRI